MPRIKLQTHIQAPRERVFNLSRSIDLHRFSMSHTAEEAVAGKTSGLIGPGEWVTWRARHFGIYQRLTSRITEFEPPRYFTDEMVRGAFKQFKHEHRFKEAPEGTLMTDIFDYESPLGPLGRLVDRLFLKRYMTVLLEKRNKVIKAFAESEKWREVL